MAKLSKRMRTVREKIDPWKAYPIKEAVGLLKAISIVKFNESIDACIKLGVDTRKSDQMLRGVVVLPNGTGRQVRVAVIAQGEAAQVAKDAGADIVGFADIAEKIKNGDIDFDTLIATPEAMPMVGQLGPILGPKGLMPNPKLGTVTPAVGEAVQRVKAGQVQFRTEKAGLIQCSIGKLNFTEDAIAENLISLIEELKKVKPATSRGKYLRKISVSTTMGPGLTIDAASLA